ncbi:conserved protein of unknown function [Pseudomonas marincola]|uniref:Uncharacterized protein n=1 Tax=Pseudomonas marincola TaxID=437900 RepID=A0A653E8I8_9PSED|nr:conserved protein of unknown function [Pseudomonas marincola]
MDSQASLGNPSWTRQRPHLIHVSPPTQNSDQSRAADGRHDGLPYGLTILRFRITADYMPITFGGWIAEPPSAIRHGRASVRT